jgi:hypothetical protein
MKVRQVLGALASAILAVVSLSTAASAAPLAAPNCQWGNTYGVVVASQNLSPNVGVAQLCRDSSYNYWGYVRLTNSPTVSEYGNVSIERDRDTYYNAYLDCNDPGGNGYVLVNQHVCWTGKLDGLSGRYTFAVEGTLISSHTGYVEAATRILPTR